MASIKAPKIWLRRGGRFTLGARITIRRPNTNKLLISIIGIIFSLAYQLPNWPLVFERVNGYPMKDRFVYYTKILDYDLRTDYIFDFKFLEYFTSEWLWNTALRFADQTLGLSPHYIFFLITTLVIWRFAKEVIERVGIIYVPLLLNPLVIDLAVSQLRIAFAIAVVSFVWRGQRGGGLTVALYIAAMSLHTSMILFASMHCLINRINQPTHRNLILLCATGAATSIAIGPLRHQILGVLGDRRAEYTDMSSSTTYLLFWLIMLALLLIDWKKTISTIDGRYSLVILSLVAVNMITGGYSSRFIAVAFPSLIISMVEFRSKPANLLLLLFIPYMLLQWAYWLRLV